MRRILNFLNALYPEAVEDFTGWGHGFNEAAFEQVCRKFGITGEQIKLQCSTDPETLVASISLSDWEKQDNPPEKLCRQRFIARSVRGPSF